MSILPKHCSISSMYGRSNCREVGTSVASVCQKHYAVRWHSQTPTLQCTLMISASNSRSPITEAYLHKRRVVLWHLHRHASLFVYDIVASPMTAAILMSAHQAVARNSSWVTSSSPRVHIASRICRDGVGAQLLRYKYTHTDLPSDISVVGKPTDTSETSPHTDLVLPI